MRITGIVQTVSLMLIMALASSCATSNQYVSKLFAPRPILNKDTTQLAVKFLELDSLNGNEEQWVKTDITRKDTTSETGIPSTQEPVAKTGNPDTRLPGGDGTRTKRTRD